MAKTAYEKWLLMITGGEVGEERAKTVAELILNDCREQSPMAFELLERTGDKTYNGETFKKAALIVLEAE